MLKQLILPLLILLVNICFAQNTSIHEEQSAYFKALGSKTIVQYDSIQAYSGKTKITSPKSNLQKRVFGYHPYWMGNAWQNYRWDLLSDLCYFSYDTDPATGNPVTTNGFESAVVVDTALAHGVKVHLCVTLFSGHATFFNNPEARQTLIGNLITLVTQRGIQGINLDFEAVPSSQQQGLTSFILEIAGALHTNLPGTELSIAAPAVNWSNTFDLPAIAPSLDLIMIMAYDFYWSGSDLAGPVSGYWPLTSSFNYAVNHSLSYYQSQGIAPEKLLLGLPYYGREWSVSANTLPASTTGSSTAVTYRNVRNNSSGFYTPGNQYWDPYSYNPYYSYFNGNWWQCFYDDVRSLGAKYDLVNRRNTGGIGIWALGYDNGYPELWDLIEEKFTQSPGYPCRDTLYDPGGPWWNYGDDECYTETVTSDYPGPLLLNFEAFDFESGYDSLWIYDGPDTNAPLLAALSGGQVPSALATTGNSFTLRFNSDGATTRSGYALEWSCPTASINETTTTDFSIYPNPADDQLFISSIDNKHDLWSTELFDVRGRLIQSGNSGIKDRADLSVADCREGVYVLKVNSNGNIYFYKIVICH